ncbi:MAG: hypothetical protein DRZ79_02335 [Candidatus Cloacimonadota bacterium]|nr:MAG: hypothetical protein DRZ79_02335 [Candidatus Cloacimonadota bacterium]
MKKIFAILFLIIGFETIFSAEIEVQSYVDKTKVGTQDILKLTVEISGKNADKVNKPHLPKINNFSVVGSYSSSSSSVTIINGRMQSSITKTYEFSLQPQKAGKFIIPPISVKYKHKTYTTEPITITVVEGSTEPAPPVSGRTRNPYSSSSSNSDNYSNKLSDNLFITAEIDKKSVFEGEPITVTYKLYSRYDIYNLDFENEPNFNGFWKEDVYTPNRLNFRRTTKNGRLYYVMTVRKVALFPTQTGRLVIPPLAMNVQIRTEPRSFFDFGETRNYLIKSKQKSVLVKELPAEGKPADFSGAVGKFTISGSISTNELKAGDSFTYTLKISGTGNLNNFDPPQLPQISNLRFIEPEITTDINKDKISGTKIIKYLVIAQEKGNYTIPSLTFSYFDTSEKRYKTLKTKSYNLVVHEGESIYVPAGSSQSLVLQEGKDIGFIIKTEKLKNTVIYFDSFLFWFLWIIFALSVPITFVIAKEQEKTARNLDYLRQKQAKKILKKYMKTASEYARKNKPEFYAAVQVGLNNYLADKLKIPRGSTQEFIISEIEKRGLPEDILSDLKNIFDKCNKARFMPGGFSEKNIQNDYKEVQRIVNDISKTKI